MENFRTCPICLEVPESEIFQCSAGHVICNSCISKVNRGLCPTCRVPFGTPKIRNRALEEILDAQDFECKFKDNGCTRLCKRVELTTHGNSCYHKPVTVPLCLQMGYKKCGFRLGCGSKAEVILHFKNQHNTQTKSIPGLSFSIKGKYFSLSRKRNLDASTMERIGFSIIVCTDTTDTSPLFLTMWKVNHFIGCWSFVCIKVWDSRTPLAVKYNANFTFSRDLSSNPSQGQSSSSASRINEYHPFPFSGTMTVSNIKEAHQLCSDSPINIPTYTLMKNGFGSSSLDTVVVKVRPVPVVFPETLHRPREQGYPIVVEIE